MAPRRDLQKLLDSFLEDGNRAYHQPPENLKMVYPCIVYARDFAKTEFSANSPYRISNRYQVTIIDSDPDSPIKGKVERMPSCLFARSYVSGSLNHTVYNLYF